MTPVHFEKRKKPTMGGFFRVFCEKTRKNPGGLGFFKKSGFFANPGRGQIRRRSLDECWSGNPAGCWAGPVYIHPRFQGGPGQIGILNSDWLTIWDAVDAVGTRRSEDAPLGHSCLTC